MKHPNHPPYHLRTNKAVDRLLLVNLLRELGGNCKEFTYYSLAGPFLEDLRVMSLFFPEMQLVSLESDSETYKRQKFHQFDSRLTLRDKSLSDFITNCYEPGEKDIFWLDYTDLSYECFDEFQVVLKKVPPGSVVRITLRAEPELNTDALESYLSGDEIAVIRAKAEKSFEEKYQKVLPNPVPDGASSSFTAYARTVQLMVQQAASLALDTAGSQVDFLPVQSTRYNDNTQMLSVTGVICPRAQIDATREKLKSVHFVDFEWQEPTQINIPALSLKERFSLECHLPVPKDQDAGDELFKILQYCIASTETRSKRQLAHYAKCYQEYPNFVRITI